MTITELMRVLQQELEEHGDLDVLGYTDKPEVEYPDILVEYSNDDPENPVVLLTLAK